jgi:hypothetical protein
VTNYGTTTATFNTTCNIYDSSGTTLYTNTQAVNNLAPGLSNTVNFTGSWTVPAYGEYSTVVYTSLSGDVFPLNDTATVNSICYHDASARMIRFPFAEQTVNYGKAPRVDITNLGSYAENIPVTCEIYDGMGTLVYTGLGASYLNPLQSANVSLSPDWVPVDTDLYDLYCFTTLGADFNPANDTAHRQTDVTTEILYDDGLLDVYGYVSSNYYENKFAVKMLPCLAPPYRIIRARCYLSAASPILYSLNRDSLGLPGLAPAYEIAPPETIYPAGAGWAEQYYSILISDPDPFWMIVHWLSSSPTAPYVGMDNTVPRDSASWWYWTEPSNPGWHFYAPYDFMMRVLTVPNLAVEENASSKPHIFWMSQPFPNPGKDFSKLEFTVPHPGELKIAIYDVAGRLVWNFNKTFTRAENSELTWHKVDNLNHSAGSGIYFIKAEFDGNTCQRKVVLIE